MIETTLKTGDNASEDVRRLLVEGELKAIVGLTGNIYPISRPDNSEEEDVVVKTLALGAMQIQEGVVNVNVHAPSIDAGPAGFQPDRIRLNMIGNEIVKILDDTYSIDHHFHLDTAPIIQPDRAVNKWFLNIRIRYYSLRTENRA